MDIIHDNFITVPLEKAPNEDIITLGDVVHTFVQWPKRDIALDPIVPRLEHDHASPTDPSMTPPQPSLQKASVSALVETAAKKQESVMSRLPVGKQIAHEALRPNRRRIRCLTSPGRSPSECC